LGVVSHHLLHSTVLEVALRRILPVPFQIFCGFGSVGVQIFFVISGFVIAHSLRATNISVGTAGNFILRRQLRLDPSYWVILILSLILTQGQRMVPAFVAPSMPDLKAIVLNVFYLQNITGAEAIVGVAWTLCLEIQFYLVMIGLLAVGRCLDKRPGPGLSGISVLLLFVTGVISLTLAPHQRVFGAWMPPFWSYFAAGAICKWSLEKKGRGPVFLAFAALFAAATVWHNTQEMIAGLVTVLSLYTVGRMGHLSDWLRGRLLQYLGRISYSLYLIHLPVLSLIMRGGYKLTHANPWAALGWFMAAAGCSVAAAHLLYIAVERPAMRFAAGLKKRTARENGPESASPMVDPAAGAAIYEPIR